MPKYRLKAKIVDAVQAPEGYWIVTHASGLSFRLNDKTFQNDYEPVIAPGTLVEEVHELLAPEES